MPKVDSVQALVVTHKRGDETALANHRGIALANACFRISDKIAQLRLQEGVADAEAICSEQGGFQRFEEVLARTVGRWETVHRRHMAGLTPFVSFKDLCEAFDVVPHAALLAKCKGAGARAKLLAFIKGQHEAVGVCLKLPAGLSEIIQHLTGIPRGAGVSPSNFLVFINDRFDQAREAGRGVPVPMDPCFHRAVGAEADSDDEISDNGGGGGMQTPTAAEDAHLLCPPADAHLEAGEVDPESFAKWRAKANRLGAKAHDTRVGRQPMRQPDGGPWPVPVDSKLEQRWLPRGSCHRERTRQGRPPLGARPLTS